MNSFRISRASLEPGLSQGPNSLVDVTIVDGYITTIEASRHRATGDIDADGALLRPGLWDNHVHFSLAAIIESALPIPAEASHSQVLDQLREVANRPSGQVIGYGFCSATWPSPPHRADLDLLGRQPIALISRDLHSVWCNGAALTLIGMPFHPTGLLVEADAFAAIRTLLIQSPDLVETAVESFEADVAARGVVGVVDFSSGWALEAWQQRAARRELRLRVTAATYPERLNDLLDLGLPSGSRLTPQLTIGPLKVIADGSMGSRTALCSLPYPNPLPGHLYGKANYTPAELTRLLSSAHQGGITAAVHAIGDACASQVLDAFEASGARGSIEHAQCLNPTDITRMARLGLTASIQPAHQLSDRGIVEQVWPALSHQAYPMRDLLAAGIPLALGSDAPVACLDPWSTLRAACKHPFRPSQALPPLQAWLACTRNIVAVGQPADLVVTDDDDDVLLTIMGGKVTHISGGINQAVVDSCAVLRHRYPCPEQPPGEPH